MKNIYPSVHDGRNDPHQCGFACAVAPNQPENTLPDLDISPLSDY
jgi:hypothetical protein